MVKRYDIQYKNDKVDALIQSDDGSYINWWDYVSLRHLIAPLMLGSFAVGLIIGVLYGG